MMIGAQHLDSAAEAIETARRAGINLLAVKFMDSAAGGGAKLAERALSLGLDCAFHATEVEELEAALSAAEAARSRPDVQPVANFIRIEHGGLIPPNHLERLAALSGAWVVTNPGFVHYRGDKYLRDPGLAAHLYRAKSLLAAGLELAGGTDGPVTPPRPLAAIAAAISRTTIDGQLLAPNEALGVEESFALFTSRAARLARIEAGEIATGKLADLVVLPKAPFNLYAAEIAALPVDLTIVGGRVVYERGRPAIANSDSADLRTA
jgi:predicted amidohydrolase YtcJ